MITTTAFFRVRCSDLAKALGYACCTTQGGSHEHLEYQSYEKPAYRALHRAGCRRRGDLVYSGALGHRSQGMAVVRDIRGNHPRPDPAAAADGGRRAHRHDYYRADRHAIDWRRAERLFQRHRMADLRRVHVRTRVRQDRARPPRRLLVYPRVRPQDA